VECITDARGEDGKPQLTRVRSGPSKFIGWVACHHAVASVKGSIPLSRGRLSPVCVIPIIPLKVDW